jgi:hypothetical protein
MVVDTRQGKQNDIKIKSNAMDHSLQITNHDQYFCAKYQMPHYAEENNN